MQNLVRILIRTVRGSADQAGTLKQADKDSRVRLGVLDAQVANYSQKLIRTIGRKVDVACLMQLFCMEYAVRRSEGVEFL